MDDETISAEIALGSIQAIAISHLHFFDSWSKTFDDAPICLHKPNQPWVMDEGISINYWEGDQLSLFGGITLIRCGGHFFGSSGRGALLTGDTIYVVSARPYIKAITVEEARRPASQRAVTALPISNASYYYLACS